MNIKQCLAAGSNGVMIQNEEYHKLPGISGSSLKLLAESNKHFDNAGLFSMGDQAHFALGSCLHEMVLEPLQKSFVTMPSFDGRTTAGKADKAAWLAYNKDKISLPQDDYDKAVKMARNLNAIIGHITSKSINERSLFAEYAPGVIIKCRIDAQYGGDDYDIKTITPKHGMDENELHRHSKALGYYDSAALRVIVRESLGIECWDSYLAFVSTSPGHMVKVRRIPDLLLAEAKQRVYALLEKRNNYVNNSIIDETKEIEYTFT